MAVGRSSATAGAQAIRDSADTSYVQNPSNSGSAWRASGPSAERAVFTLLRAIAACSNEDTLLSQLTELLSSLLPGERAAVHFREVDSPDWRLASHCGLSDADVVVLAGMNSPPEPLVGATTWTPWEPVTHPRTPWLGLQATLDGPCLVMPAHFVDGTFAGAITLFELPTAERAETLRNLAPLLWLVRAPNRNRLVLSRHENRYSALAECSPDSIWRLDGQHRIAYVNRTSDRVGSGPSRRCIGRHVLDCLPQSAHEKWTTALATMTQSGANAEVLYSQAGREYAARLAPEVGGDGRVTGVVATIRDITDAIRSLAERDAAVLRGQLVAEITRSVVYDRKIADETSYVSPTMATVFGYAPAQFKRGGLSWWIEQIHPDDRAQLTSRFAGVRSGEADDWSVEYRVRKADGSWATVIDQGRIVCPENPALTRHVGAVSDITAIRALQNQLHHSHRVELIGRLAGGVAHDFNNVLAAIGGFTELLLSTTPTTDERAADLLEIAALVGRAGALTKNLLGLSRRREQSDPVMIPVGEAVLNLAPTLRTLLGSGVTLAIESIPEGLTVNLDPGHLDQVILNLAVNARDAMPDGGTVTIRAALRDEPTPNDPECGLPPVVVLEVSDCGLGIPADVLKKIFQPFFTTKPEGHGTGLGLSVVNDIVQGAGGTITVNSTPGVGTTFAVQFPFATGSGSSTGVDDGVQDYLPSCGTVLVIEDEETVRRSTKRILEREGMMVIEARTGDAGLAALIANREMIDVVLSDLYLPGLSGPALVMRLRAEAPEVSCVVISGHPERFDKLAPEPGALAVLTKPCRAPQLLARVTEFVAATRLRRMRIAGLLTDAGSGSVVGSP
jgi:PAS domain S-box-containing protein